MPYNKTLWVNDSAPYINDTNLNKIETGIETAQATAEAAQAAIPTGLLNLGITDGTSGQVLTTDGSGNFSFADASGSETLTSISFASNTLTYVDENSNSTNIDLSSLAADANTYVASGALSGNTLTLTLSDASTVDIDLSTLSTFSGDYADLTNTPTIPSATSELTNDSGFLTAETITSLSVAGNTLTFTDETGADTNIDLSLYIDDTNLARITSGTYDNGTGIATFTRDDATTFTVDFSAITPFSGDYNDLTNQPTLFDGAYSSLTGAPSIPADLTDLGITDGTAGQILSTDGAGTFTFTDASAGGSTTLLGLTDVGADGTAGQVLTTDGAGSFTFTTVSGGSGIALTDLSVSTGAASGSGTLSYDNGTGVFSFAPADLSSYALAADLPNYATTASLNNVAFSGNIDDLVDVDITTSLPTVGQALAWDGSNFVPTTIAASFDGQFSSLTGTPTTIAGYGITDAFDGAYSSLTGAPTIPSVLTDLSITDGTSGQVLTTDGAGSFSFTSVSGTSGAINDLSDVDTFTLPPTTGQVLSWDSTNWVPTTVAAGATSLDELSDVDTTTTAPTDGQALIFDNASSTWIPGTVSSSGGSSDPATPTSEGILYGSSDLSSTNTALGYQATTASTTGTNNTSVGYQASNSLTTGANNTHIGYRASNKTTTGSFGVAIGYLAECGTEGNGNVSIGYNTGTALSTGGQNTIIGYDSGKNLTTQSDNVILGYRTAQNLQSGSNTVLGAWAGNNLTTGNNNTIIGRGSGATLSTGFNNLIMGPEAAKNISGGASSNVILGPGSVGRSVNVALSQSVAIGYRAYVGGEGGGNNIAIGTSAGPDETLYPNFNGNGSTWIGYNARPTTRYGSNEFVCGGDALTKFVVPGPGLEVTAAKTTLPGALQLEVLSAEPTPAAGMIAVADGTTWNPLGTGVEQCVIYLNGAWTALA